MAGTDGRSPALLPGDCVICMGAVKEKKTLKCLHSLGSECVDSFFKLKAPCWICNTYHGVYTGGRTITATRSSQHVPGLERCGSIVIQYRFPAGGELDRKRHEPEHPNPGVRYSSTCCTAFLPACDEAAEESLGQATRLHRRTLCHHRPQQRTYWNDKTSMGGGPQSFGYPDPEYLFRFQEELRLEGVTGDD